MKRTASFYVVLAVVCSALLGAFIVGSIYDLQISKILVDLPKGEYVSNNIIAVIGESFGENALYVLLQVAFAILFYHLIKNKPFEKWLNITLAVILGLLGGFTSFYCLNKTLSYIAVHTNFGMDNFLTNVAGKISVVFMALVFFSLILLGFYFVKKETIKELVGFAIAILIITLVSNVIVQGTKHIFDRTRYRAMIYEGDTSFEHFTPWYEVNKNKFASTKGEQFVDDYFKSFPSGHSCAAGSIFILTLLPCFLKKTDNMYWRATFITVSIIYTLFVMISRIVAGAHFFTDVFVGALAPVACTCFYKWFYLDWKDVKLETAPCDKIETKENLSNEELEQTEKHEKKSKKAIKAEKREKLLQEKKEKELEIKENTLENKKQEREQERKQEKKESKEEKEEPKSKKKDEEPQNKNNKKTSKEVKNKPKPKVIEKRTK